MPESLALSSTTWVPVVTTLATLILLFVLFKGRWILPEHKNRKPTTKLDWNGLDTVTSLAKVLEYVEEEARSATDWYWSEKSPKARASRIIQGASLILTAWAGLVPVVIPIARSLFDMQDGVDPWWANSAWPTILVGTAAALLGLDRYFGFSSAWARYVLAATEINRRLAEFRMDWLALNAAVCPAEGPSCAQVAALIQKAKEFRVAVESIVVQETKEWATEFQSNVAQLEKDLRVQFEQLKTQLEQARQAQAAAQQLGSLQVAVHHGAKPIAVGFVVELIGVDGPVMVAQKVEDSSSWTRVGVPPGQYSLKISAALPDPVSGVVRSQSMPTVVTVTPGSVVKVTVEFPG